MDRKKVAIYARVSTRDQDPEMQLLDLRRYAIGISGTRNSRPALSIITGSLLMLETD
jgi:DNA invertase Pin-like site-specific DNA recombinase